MYSYVYTPPARLRKPFHYSVEIMVGMVRYEQYIIFVAFPLTLAETDLNRVLFHILFQESSIIFSWKLCSQGMLLTTVVTGSTLKKCITLVVLFGLTTSHFHFIAEELRLDPTRSSFPSPEHSSLECVMLTSKHLAVSPPNRLWGKRFEDNKRDKECSWESSISGWCSRQGKHPQPPPPKL